MGVVLLLRFAKKRIVNNVKMSSGHFNNDGHAPVKHSSWLQAEGLLNVVEWENECPDSQGNQAPFNAYRLRPYIFLTFFGS